MKRWTHGRILTLCGVLSVMSAAADWPHWRGPDHNGTSREPFLVEGGPARLAPPVWQYNVGEGCGSVVSFAGRIYSSGWHDGHETVFCLDAADGRVLWSQRYACPRYGRRAMGDQGWYAGPTATPVMDPETHWLYTLSADGDLRGWDTRREGRLQWAVNLYDAYDVPRRPDVGGGQRDFGFTTAPLVHGDILLVALGPPEGLLLALDKRTGQRRWASVEKDFASNSGGMSPLHVDGIPCVAVLSLTRLVVVRLDEGREGETLAVHPWQTDFANNLVSPTVVGDRVLLSSDYNIKRTVLLQITPRGATPLWQSRRYSGVGSPAIHQDHIYFAFNKLRCLRLSDGEEVWSGGHFGPDGSCLVTSDGFVVAHGSGKVAVVETAARNDASYREVSAMDGLAGRNQAWPHVVLANGNIYSKDRQGRIQCLPIRPAQAPEATLAGSNGTDAAAAPQPPAAATLFAWNAGDEAGALKARGDASLAADGSLVLEGGSFALAELADPLLAACRHADSLHLELVFTAADTQQGGPARIVSFSEGPYKRNFTLGQERDLLVLRLRTPATGENGMKPETQLGRVVADRQHRLVVSYEPGRLSYRLDDQDAVVSDAVRGDFSNWERQPLLLGNEFTQDRPWKGRIHAIRIGTRAAADAPPTGTAAAPPTDAFPSALADTPLPAGVTAGTDARGRPLLTIATPKARFVYDMKGGGLSSLLDAGGRDWIRHGTDVGARGSYRGIPNLIHPESGFHPGSDRCISRLEAVQGAVAAIRSETTDGQWDCRWTFYDGYAVLDVNKTAHSYWFLYEGTPGGVYDEGATWMMDSAQRRRRATERWEQRLPDPRWIAFGRDNLTTTLFLADLTERPADVVDSFWSMDQRMTVFGFGRSLRQGERWHHLREAPARFVIGFADGHDPAALTSRIGKILENLAPPPQP